MKNYDIWNNMQRSLRTVSIPPMKTDGFKNWSRLQYRKFSLIDVSWRIAGYLLRHRILFTPLWCKTMTFLSTTNLLFHDFSCRSSLFNESYIYVANVYLCKCIPAHLRFYVDSICRVATKDTCSSFFCSFLGWRESCLPDFACLTLHRNMSHLWVCLSTLVFDGWIYHHNRSNNFTILQIIFKVFL